MGKRIISLFLAIMMVISTPVFAFATEEQPETSVSSGNMTVEGTNGFGNLVSRTINDQVAETNSEATAGYTVTSLEITGNTATVTYGSIEDATLVVGIYTEDGTELLCSGFTEILAEEGVATVVIDGEMPEYFWASAYLLDNYDFSPLSNAFETPLYTKDMQDLLASSADDYEEERLLNLDDNTDTNFAVFSEETIIVDEQEGVNTVTSVDDSSATYVIENADESITGLQQGDIFAYPYGEDEILIVKVDSIRVNGTTATITGQDVELEEVFDYVKVEGSSEGVEPVVDESVASEGITYEGIVPFEDSATFGLGRAIIDEEKNFSETCGFSVDLNLVNSNNVKVKISGSLELKNDFDISVYVTLFQQYIYFKDDVSVKQALSISGSITSDPISLPSFSFSPVPGLSIGFYPELTFTFEGKIEFFSTITFTVGFDFQNPIGASPTTENLCTAPKMEWDGMEVEASFTIELDLSPSIAFLEKVAKASLKVPVGAKFSVQKAPEELSGESIHTCKNCFDGTITGMFSVGVEIGLFDSDMLTAKKDFKKFEFELGKFYYSHDHVDFGFGVCPYRSFLVTVVVRNQNQDPAENIEIKLLGGSSPLSLGSTNKSGLVSKYVSSGEYTISSTAALEGQTNIKVTNEAKKAVVYLYQAPSGSGSGTSGSGSTTGLGKIDPTTVTTASVVGSGNCGAEGDNFSWMLYDDGLLVISGQGDMGNFEFEPPNVAPWYEMRRDITEVIIRPGVTSIGDDAFWDCSSLTSIEIPNSVTSIGDDAFCGCESLTSIEIPNSVTCICGNAFYGCTSLTSIEIPNSVTSIGDHAFWDCSSLTSIEIPNSVTSIGNEAFRGCLGLTSIEIPNSVTSIGDDTFWDCSSLTSIEIPDSVTSIGDHAFWDCSSLTSIEIPDSVTSIGYGAFIWCESLTSIKIPNSVTSIGGDAFSGCTSLTNIEIPNSVTSIGDDAFEDCSSLTSIKIPNSVTTIGGDAFYGCTSLTSIDIPDSVTSIGDYAFCECTSLTSIEIPNSVTCICGNAFYGCTSLTSIEIPNSVKTIGGYAFCECTSLTSIEIPNSVTSIGDNTFWDCSSLTSIEIPNSVTSIGDEAFGGCESLTSIKIPNSVTTIGGDAFYGCTSLTSIDIPDSVTYIGEGVFNECPSLTDVYYGGSEVQWNAIEIGDGNDSLLNATIHYNFGVSAAMLLSDGQELSSTEGTESELNIEEVMGTAVPVDDIFEEGTEEPADLIQQFSAEDSGAVLASIVGGEYDSTEFDTYVLRQATFADLVPGQQYVILALKDMEAAEPLAKTNLVYIDQAAALEDGSLVFEFVDRESLDTCYIMACGASNKSLKDAVITFPEMTVGDEPQVVSPTVVYDGVTLVEGIDYVLLGEVAYSEAKEYTCYIRGIFGYSGLVECIYKPNAGNPAPVKITTQPTNVTVADGATAKTTVVATGDGLKYQWYFTSNASDSSFSKSGTTTATYSTEMNADRDGRKVYCVVTDKYGNSVTSNTVTLSMGTALNITTQPTNVTVANGATAKTTVKATGDGLTYQWYFTSNASDSSFSKSGTTTATYSTEMNADRDGRKVYCVVTDKYGNTVKSNTVTLSMSATSLKIATQPTNVTVADGATAKTTVVATGDGLKYQWYFTSNASDSSFSKSGTTTATYSTVMNADRDGRKVYCVVTDKYGNSVTSNTVTLSMGTALKITTQPTNVTVANGATAKATVKATGEGLKYQWYFTSNASDSSFSKSGTTTATYSTEMNADRDGRKVYCVVTDKYGNTVKSNTVTLSMSAGLKITTQPTNVTVANGATAKTTVKATGDGLTYQWYFTSNASDSSFSKSGTTAATYSTVMNADRDGRQVYCVVTDKYGNSVKSNTVTLNMK